MNPRIAMMTGGLCAVATVFAAGAAWAAPPPARRMSPQLRSVRLRSAEQSIQVTFVTTGPVRYKTTRTEQPSRITIDLLQTSISPAFTRREILSVHPALIRVLITRSSGFTRAVLDLAAAGSHSVYTANDQLIVEIKVRPKRPDADAGQAPVAVPAQPASPAAATPQPSVGTAPPAGPALTKAVSPAISDNAVKIPWVPSPPTIEEFTSPNPRTAAVRVGGFRQREPSEGDPVSEETTVYLAYDSERLYAVFVCRERSGDLRSRLVPRDAIADDDHVVVYLDTFRDGRHAYVFASNPSGVQQDGVISDGDDVSYIPDMVWRAQGRRTARGFVVLMAIPFKSLRFSAGWIQHWRIALGRTIARRSESAYWPFITRGANGFVEQMAALEGLELISQGSNVQLAPYGTFAREQSFDSGPLATMSEAHRGGLDAKVVIRNAVAIDAAVNPDFSEVESDDPLVTANQRFELFRPERRPFFTENAAVFETPINVMFSRRIVDPDAGLRLTARSSGWAIGGLVANDRLAPAQSSRLFGPGARVRVVRVQRLSGDRSNMGVLATERVTSSSRNRVVSVDGRVQLTSAWGFAGQVLRSEDWEQASGRRIGAAYSAAISRTGPHFTYAGSYRDIDHQVRVPLGFVPRVDIRATEQYAGYVWHLGDSGAWSVGPSATAVINWNQAGDLQDRWTSADLALSHAGYLDAHASRAQAYERFGATAFRTEATTATFSSSRVSGWLYLWGHYEWGTAINYTPPPDVPAFLGARRGAYGSITIRPSAWLDIEQMVLHEQLDTMPDGPSAATETVFNTSIIRSQANLQLTKSLTLRGVVDVSQLASTPALFAEASSRRLGYDVLFRFVPNPGTAFYVGFNKRYEGVAGDPRSRTLGILSVPGVPAGQRIFAKISYLFRL